MAVQNLNFYALQLILQQNDERISFEIHSLFLCLRLSTQRNGRRFFSLPSEATESEKRVYQTNGREEKKGIVFISFFLSFSLSYIQKPAQFHHAAAARLCTQREYFLRKQNDVISLCTALNITI